MAAQIRRVVVLTADVGEGHLAAARVLAAGLTATAPGIEVVTVDALELLGRTLRLVLRDAYRVQLRRLPWLFALFFLAFLRLRLLRATGRLFLAGFGARRMRSTLEALSPDLVVSTYPAATSVLGTLRRRRRLQVPAYATVTDLAGAEFWAHPGIDLHLVMHDSLVPVIEREAGPGSARTVAPLVGASFHAPLTRLDARRALGLPLEQRIVVVSGGGWAVGDVAGATAEGASLPDTTVVCLTGRNERLHAELDARYAENENVRVVGFTDRMAELLAAADVVVHTTGGVTCLEAMTLGRPIVAFGPPPGHAPTLARAMARLGVAAHARSREELRAALVAPPPARRTQHSSSAIHELLTATCRGQVGRSRHRRTAAAVGLAAATAAAFLTFGTRSAFGVDAHPTGRAPRSVAAKAVPHVELAAAPHCRISRRPTADS